MTHLKKRVPRWAMGLALVLFAAVAVASGSAQASTLDEIHKNKVVRVGWGVWFPYMYRDPKTKEVAGITVDLYRELAKRLEVKVDFVEDSWATMIAGLNANKYDVTMPIAVTPPRAEVIDFTRPIIRNKISMMVRGADIGKYSNWKDLDKPGLKITTTLGSSIHTAVAPKIKNAELILVKAAPESLAQLISGKVDAWANSHEALLHVKKDHPELEVVPGEPVGYDQVVIGIRKGDKETKEWFDKTLTAMMKDGTILKVIEKNGLNSTFLAE